MHALSRSRRKIESAWRSFVLDGCLSESVRPEIRRSWQRVRGEWRVDPGLRICPGVPADEALVREVVEDAFREAAPLIRQFADRMAPDGHVVGYFDADGVMLTLEGNRRTRSRLAAVNFAPGACWSERAAGTNGPGTALAEARPVEVFASEHFVEAWQPWTCASVPVRVGGHVVGAVDITSPWTAHHPGLLLTAEALARAVEARLEAAAARVGAAVMKEVAQEALRARDAFLAVASHELKTPLTPLRLKLQKVQRLVSSGAAPDPERLREALRGADEHIRRLAGFVDDLVDRAQLAHEPILLAPGTADLGAVVADAVERRRPELERQGCSVTVAACGELSGPWDPTRLGQAVEQLLVNAMTFAPGPIEVRVEGAPDGARVSVRDHGPGIAPESWERIFLPYERAVSYRNVPGFGLGLHLVREIVEAHGGEVRLDSAPGRGSVFTIELPRAAAEEPAAIVAP
jgi:signal transduction histidine kinase